MNWNEKGVVLWEMICQYPRNLCHDSAVGGQAARMSAIADGRVRGREKLAMQWVTEAREALTAPGLLSLTEVQSRFGEKASGKQMKLL